MMWMRCSVAGATHSTVSGPIPARGSWSTNSRPVLTAPSVGELLNVSAVAAGRALDQPDGRGIIKLLNEKNWGRAWEASKLLTIVQSFERRVGGGRASRA